MPSFSKYSAKLIGPVDQFVDRIANARRNHFDEAVSSGEDEACTSDGLKSGMPLQKRSASTDRIRNITRASAVVGSLDSVSIAKTTRVMTTVMIDR
jgi:hypothetical protein